MAQFRWNFHRNNSRTEARVVRRRRLEQLRNWLLGFAQVFNWPTKTDLIDACFSWHGCSSHSRLMSSQLGLANSLGLSPTFYGCSSGPPQVPSLHINLYGKCFRRNWSVLSVPFCEEHPKDRPVLLLRSHCRTHVAFSPRPQSSHLLLALKSRSLHRKASGRQCLLPHQRTPLQLDLHSSGGFRDGFQPDGCLSRRHLCIQICKVQVRHWSKRKKTLS